MKDLTQGNEAKLILNFTIPMLLGNVFQQLYNIIDSAVVGHFLGKEALAAVGASMPIIFLLIALIIGVSMGTTIVISQYFGAKDYEKVKRAIDTMYIFFFFSSILLTCIGIVASGSIFRLTRLPEEIIPQARIFINIFLIGLIFAFGFNGTSAALRGMGDSRTPLYFLVISTFTNIALVLLFVLVFHWGIAGAALSTVVSQAGACLTAILYLNRHHEIMHFSFRTLRFDRDIFFKSLKIGLPTGFQQAFVALGGMALYGIVNGYGTNVIAGYAAGGRIDSFAMLPAMNFSMGLATFVGQNLGANKIDRVVRGLKATLLMSSITCVLISLVIIIFGHYLMHLFSSDPEVIRVGQEYLVIVSLFYILFSTMFSFNGVLRGAGDTLIPMFITLCSLWLIRLPFAYFFSRFMGEKGIWWSVGVAWIIGASCSFFYYRTGHWKKKALVAYPVEEAFTAE